ncbi:MAG: B12-binding domain-containing radical SAM protein [Peptostreptococcaceae bacterium]|nr:B12-binding domain-containing radical SAM protein [Peptostreptococcaceae bacterium]
MKVLLVALNSQFVHSSLSIHSLYSAVKEEPGFDILIKEYTINQEEDHVLRDLTGEKPDLICFSCYIWNIEIVRRLTRNIKKIDPSINILLGGPEVSYAEDCDGYELPEADYVLRGEGEGKLLDFLRGNSGEDRIEIIEDLKSLSFPYTEEELYESKDKILYYESSRGCPYRCSYCLSSIIKKTRYKDIDMVKHEMDIFLSHNVKQVKFVDRTFNADAPRAVAIMEYLTEKDNGRTNFHFEISGDLIGKAFIDTVSASRKGLFQFEVGVQSTNQNTLHAVNRKTDFDKLSYWVKRLMGTEKSHVHLDLIAGLPFEDYASFKTSFNDVYSVGGHHLQLGFLKLLPGTDIRKNAKGFGYAFKSEPPYEVLMTNVLSHSDISRLKCIEDVLERYGNSGGFLRSMEYFNRLFNGDAFGFYEAFSDYLKENDFFERAHSKRKLYGYLFDYHETLELEKDTPLFLDILKFDYLRQKPQTLLPIFNIIEPEGYKNACHQFLKDAAKLKKTLPAYEGLPAKKIINKVHFEPFGYNVDTFKKERTHVLFDYESEKGFMGESEYHFVSLTESGKEKTNANTK